MKFAILRARTIFADRLLFSPFVRSIARQIKLGRRLSKKDATPEEDITTISVLCSCVRLSESKEQIVAVEKRIDSVIGQLDLNECNVNFLDPDGDLPRIQKALFLKPWNSLNGEKGVIFISFEYQWVRLLSLPPSVLKRFAEQYTLVVSPTWTPPHSVVNYLFPRLYPAPVYCLISNGSDMDTFPRLSGNYRMVHLFASNWVNPDLFAPRPRTERDIDIVMLANFGTYKRHHILFRALREMPNNVRVTLIGQPNGKRTAEVLLAEAEAFGVRDRIQLLERVSDETVVDTLCRSKVSLIFSRREGSCVAVVESLFSNTPVGLVKDAQIGSAEFINAETGRYLDEDHLAEDLMQFLADSDEMNPEKWAVDNGLSAQASGRKLNQVLKESALSGGQLWQSDIAGFHWRPDPRLLCQSDSEWQIKEQSRVKEVFNLEIGVK